MTTVPLAPLPDLDRAALAELVAHPTNPRPFLIASDNERQAWADDVHTAARSGTAYALTVAPDVLAWDLDTDAHARAGHALAAELRRLDRPTLLTPSGRDGHLHLWAVVPDQSERARVRERGRAHGLPDPRRVMRPPGAPHRSGEIPEFLDCPAQFLHAAEAARAAAEANRGRLDWRELLATGKWPRGWQGEGSGSAMVWHVCIGAARAGHGLDTVRRMLADETNRGGATYRGRLTRHGKQHGDYWLDRYVWPSALRRASVALPADAHEAREQLDALVAVIEATPWPGQAGATRRALLLAVIARGHKRGSLTPTMSYREMAEDAPCSFRTVVRHAPALVADGWLQKVEQGRGRTVIENGEHRERADATQWRIRIPVARPVTTGGTPPARTSLSGDSTRARLDACRWGALGLNVPRVLDELTARGPLDVTALAGALGLNRGNLRARLLPRLASHGLVTRGVDGRWAVAHDLDAALSAAAEALGVTGKADAVAAQHAAERSGYLEWRETTRPAREARKRARIASERRAARHDAQPTLWAETLDERPGAVDPAAFSRALPPPGPRDAALALAGSGGGSCALN